MKTPSTARIVIGHTIYAFKDGGMERGLLNIINHGDWDRFSHVIMCLTEAGVFVSQISSPTCKVIEFHKREGNDYQLPKRIAKKAREYRLQVMHARGWPALVETAIAARLAGVRRTIYGFHGKMIEELHGVGLKRRLAERFIIRSYDRVVTLNPRMRTDFAASCGLPENRIHLIANGVDVNAFRPVQDHSELRAAFGIPMERFVVGNVARLDPVKNHNVIFRGLARLRELGVRPYFLLVGEGPHRAALEREIQRLGLHKDVRLFGYSDRIAELLNCMDVYVQSSLYEGFSNTIIEAMACGLPILATDVGGTADLFSEGVEGWFFSPEDDETLASLLLQLQRNPSLRERAAGRGRQRVIARFSAQAMVREYENLYLKLTAGVEKEKTGSNG